MAPAIEQLQAAPAVQLAAFTIYTSQRVLASGCSTRRGRAGGMLAILHNFSRLVLKSASSQRGVLLSLPPSYRRSYICGGSQRFSLPPSYRSYICVVRSVSDAVCGVVLREVKLPRRYLARRVCRLLPGTEKYGDPTAKKMWGFDPRRKWTCTWGGAACILRPPCAEDIIYNNQLLLDPISCLAGGVFATPITTA